MKKVIDCSLPFNFSDISKFFVHSSFFNNSSIDEVIDSSSSLEIFSLVSSDKTSLLLSVLSLSLLRESGAYFKQMLHTYLQTQGKISGLISLNCTDERTCYTDRCIQEVLRFALHLKSSFWYKSPASDSSLNVVGEIRMHISDHRSCRTLRLQGLLLSLANARIFQTDVPSFKLSLISFSLPTFHLYHYHFV